MCLAFYCEALILDLFSLFFLRTRTSLKFFPMMSFLLIFGHLYYLNCNPYSFDLISVCCLISLLTLLMSIFVVCVEKPALTVWDPQNINTPKIRVPRMLFNPCFNTNWIKEPPQIWTIFMPLFGRSYFDRRHLAFIDNQVQNLVIYNQGNESGENNLLTFDERHLINIPGFLDDDVHYRV